LAACVLRATTRKRSSTFLRKKCTRVTWLEDFLHDLEMTWLLYCAGAATASLAINC